MGRLPNPCLALFTDRTALRPNVTLAQAIAPAVTGGVNLVVLQETDLPANHRLTVARFVRDGVRARVPYLIAGDPQLALEAGADGVHIEADDDIAAVRAVIGVQRLLGVTVRMPADAQRAVAQGADYLLFARDWKDPVVDLSLLGEFCYFYSLPILAGFDVPLDQVAACHRVGAAGIALAGSLIGAEDPTNLARAYVEAQTAEW